MALLISLLGVADLNGTLVGLLQHENEEEEEKKKRKLRLSIFVFFPSIFNRLASVWQR